MSRAQNEQQVLQQMEHHLNTFGGRIGSVNAPWTKMKLDALARSFSHALEIGAAEILHVMDVGIGDMTPMRDLPQFQERTFHYTAFEGNDRIRREAEEKYGGPGRDFIPALLSELADGKLGPDLRVDLAVCLDVLYHIPDDHLYEDFLAWLARSTRRYLLVSYATDMAAPGAPKKVGDPGFAWFPRPFRIPTGFTLIHSQNNAGTGQPQKQEVALLLRGARR